MKHVMVFGTFDRLHPGHEFVFHEAMKHGQVTVVVARGATVKRMKGKLPTESEAQRLRAIQDAFPDFTVLLGDRDDFLAPIRSARPDLILLGYDQKLPPGILEADLAPATILRLRAHHPERFKSSLLRKRKKSIVGR